MLNLRRASSRLRTDHFKTRKRETTSGIFVGYSGHQPDPRIDATILDELHCMGGRFGVGAHYLVRTDGTVEIGRDLLTIAAFGPRRFLHSHISVLVVGGRDYETGKSIPTLTPEQREALECLYQHLADELGVPLEIEERLLEPDDEMILEELIEAETEAMLDAHEAS